MITHEWIPSTLGHGETMCMHCLMTNREATVLGQACPEREEKLSANANDNEAEAPA